MEVSITEVWRSLGACTWKARCTDVEESVGGSTVPAPTALRRPRLPRADYTSRQARRAAAAREGGGSGVRGRGGGARRARAPATMAFAGLERVH